MGKAPADQFYWGDWLNDTALQSASTVSRGVWINALCRMWSAPVRGELKGTIEALAKLCICDVTDFVTLKNDIFTHKFADMSQDPVTGIVTLRNRRMYRKGKERENNRLRKERQRESRQCHADVTDPCHGNVTVASSSSYKEYKESEPVTLEKPEEKNHHPPYQEFRKLWLELLPTAIQPHPKNDTWHPDFRARWNEDEKRQDLAYWKDLIGQLIKPSRFLMGGVDPPEGRKRFQISLPWLLKRKNFYKIIQGEYK